MSIQRRPYTRDVSAALHDALRSPRQARVLSTLYSSRQWLRREEVDRIAGASNGPAVVGCLRSILGYGAIETRRVEVTDRDGRKAKPGEYLLTEAGRKAVQQLLNKQQ